MYQSMTIFNDSSSQVTGIPYRSVSFMGMNNGTRVQWRDFSRKGETERNPRVFDKTKFDRNIASLYIHRIMIPSDSTNLFRYKTVVIGL